MNYSSLIKEEAQRLGFDFCGIAKADFLEKEAPRLEQWLLQNKHGKMKYMENYFDKRLDPRRVLDQKSGHSSLLLSVARHKVESPKVLKPGGGSRLDDFMT